MKANEGEDEIRRERAKRGQTEITARGKRKMNQGFEMKGGERKAAKHDKVGSGSTRKTVRKEGEVERKRKDADIARKRSVRMKGITQQRGDIRRNDESVNGNRQRRLSVAM